MEKEDISPLRRAGRIAARVFAVLLITLFMILILLLGLIFVLSRGPSPTAQKLFVLSVRETSAAGFLADIFLTDQEILELTSDGRSIETEATDTSLIAIPTPGPSADGGQAQGDERQAQAGAESGSGIDPDGDGIDILEISGPSYRGVMMVVYDPTRIFVGTPQYLGGAGLTLMQMVENYDAIGGINAGGFYDPGGVGAGGIPDGLVICEGELLYGEAGIPYNTIGFDSGGILHVGTMTTQEALDADLQWAVSFGPVLISNGIVQDFSGALVSGINPRTAIGQRADGAVLLLVIDGRQIDSLGATYEDVASVMYEYGAVNAANLDGGSSTLMVFQGETLNVCASVNGPRLIPTGFLVRK